MKKISFLLVLVSIFCIINAQLFDLSFINHSGVTPTDHIHLRALALEELNMFDVTIEALSIYEGQHYSSAFEYVNMLEQKAILRADSGINSIGFRLNTNIDMISVVVPWRIETFQTIDKNRYMLAGESEIGNVENPNLDIQSHSLGLMPDGLAFMLENVSGDYPTVVGSIIQPAQLQLYFYGALILNPESLLEVIDFENLDLENLDIFELIAMLGDMNIYAALYTNINLILFQVQSGIKKLPVSMLTDPASINPLDLIGVLGTNIGDINPSINDGGLMMSMNFMDLQNDPDFGEWPGLTYSLLLLPITIQIVGPVSTAPAFNFDYGVPTLVYCDLYDVVHSSDLPDIALTNETLYSLQVTYSQSMGLFPVVAEFRNEAGIIQGISANSDFTTPSTFLFTSNTMFTDGTFFFSTDSLNYVELEFTVTGENDEILLPENKLSIYPNPFNPQTTISFTHNVASNLRVDIYNLKGQKIKTLIDEFMPAGNKQITWDSRDNSSGVYFVRVQSGESVSVRKAVLMK